MTYRNKKLNGFAYKTFRAKSILTRAVRPRTRPTDAAMSLLPHRALETQIARAVQKRGTVLCKKRVGSAARLTTHRAECHASTGGLLKVRQAPGVEVAGQGGWGGRKP